MWLVGATGCGSVLYVNQVTRKASTSVEAAKAAEADVYAPYHYTLAVHYLHKAREEAAAADFQAANRFGRLSYQSAEQARELAVQRAADPKDTSWKPPPGAPGYEGPPPDATRSGDGEPGAGKDGEAGGEGKSPKSNEKSGPKSNEKSGQKSNEKSGPKSNEESGDEAEQKSDQNAGPERGAGNGASAGVPEPAGPAPADTGATEDGE